MPQESGMGVPPMRTTTVPVALSGTHASRGGF